MKCKLSQLSKRKRMELNKILHPDLLAEEDLHQILYSLGVQVSTNLPKPEVLEIFKKVAVPLPQRNKELKLQRKLNDISAEFNFSEFSLWNEKIDDGRVSYDSGNIELHSGNEENTVLEDLILQFEKEFDRMAVGKENVQVSKANHLKVASKRLFDFEEVENAVIMVKRTKIQQEDIDKMVVDEENVQASKANHLEVALKRLFDFEEDENDVILVKKTKIKQESTD